MRIQLYTYNFQTKNSAGNPVRHTDIIKNTISGGRKDTPVSFEGNPAGFFKNISRFLRAKGYADAIAAHITDNGLQKSFIFRTFGMEPLEGIQYGIKVFDGMSMKDIQYMSENLHVIAVKRGCKNMCGYCYADAKPQKREMSWEDFTAITRGYKKLRKRLNNIDIFGENFPCNDDVARSTELFYDTDCIDLVIKNKKGKSFDFIDMADEINSSLGRKTVFDTSGWNPKSEVLQKRAEKYAGYYSKQENMDKLSAFNLSFNLFNASYIASVRAQRAGDTQKAQRLLDRFTDRIANAVYTFTPVLENPRFYILSRCFNSKTARNAKDFDDIAMKKVSMQVINKLAQKYSADLKGAQTYVKSQNDVEKKVCTAFGKMMNFETDLNSVGRMKAFMDEFNIKCPIQNHQETTKILIDEIKHDGRLGRHVMQRLIDTDGKVYHMDYARFFPTELQLNIPNKNIPSPPLANTVKDFTVTKEMLNRPEKYISADA